MAERELLVRIVGDDRSLQQAFNRSSRSAQQFETRTQSLGKNLQRGFGAAGIAVGATAFLAAANSSIQAASDLNEEITKSQKVFGDSADEIKAWSETTASALGISQVQALQATGIFGNLFRTVNIGVKPAAEMSKSLTQLAADLGSFNNASIDDVLLAIRSGLIGEAEPLRRYGVLLSEARVQQVALADTGKTSVKSLTDQEKALARYKIILQDTIPAQGDFADTADGLANQQKILAAESANAAANIGGLLAPAMEVATISGIGFFQAINQSADALRRLRSGLRDTDAFDGWNSAVDGAIGHVSGFFDRLRDGIPIISDFRDAVRGAFDTDIPFQSPGAAAGPDSGGGARGPGAVDAANRARADSEAAQKKAAEDAIARTERQVAAQKDLNRQLANSEARAAHLRQLIREDPENPKLQQRLNAELTKQQRLREQIATAAAQAAAADARAAETAKQAAADRRAEAQQRAQDRREAQRDAKQAAQFQALGLTAQGEERIPGIGALRRRGRRLLARIEDTGLDTPANRKRIGAVLSKQFNDAGREVRAAILRMFDEIASALNQGSEKAAKGQQTAFRVVNTSNILAGLGLSEDEEKKLRQRLSRLGPGGTTPQNTTTGGAFGLAPGGGNIVINGDVHVNADDADEFGKELEKKGRRSGSPRTGHFAGHKN